MLVVTLANRMERGFSRRLHLFVCIFFCTVCHTAMVTIFVTHNDCEGSWLGCDFWCKRSKVDIIGLENWIDTGTALSS